MVVIQQIIDIISYMLQPYKKPEIPNFINSVF